jgi:hypothetical protein
MLVLLNKKIAFKIKFNQLTTIHDNLIKILQNKSSSLVSSSSSEGDKKPLKYENRNLLKLKDRGLLVGIFPDQE